MNTRFVVFAWLISLAVPACAATRTWTGEVNNDWYEPGNWTPPGTPAAADTLNVNGSPNVSPLFTLTGQLNWNGGAVFGALILGTGGTMNWQGGELAATAALTVAFGAVLNLGPGDIQIRNTVTNRG